MMFLEHVPSQRYPSVLNAKVLPPLPPNASPKPPNLRSLVVEPFPSAFSYVGIPEF